MSENENENFELWEAEKTGYYEYLETDQIELLHRQTHDRQGEADNCDALRQQHDSLAAELGKRGIPHDTEMVCPESELAGAAPNYRRGFTDDVCNHCAFGQLYPYCNLYNADYAPGYTCDSFQYFEILELEPPHGFLVTSGKETAIALPEPLAKASSQARVIVSNGEAFGIATFDEPAQIKTKEFDTEDWQSQHRITPRERRQWWPDAETFYIYRLKEWRPYEGVKLYEDGKIIDEPRLTASQWQIVSKAKQLPKQIILENDFISLNCNNDTVYCGDSEFYNREVKPIINATFNKQIGIDCPGPDDDIIPLYSLALVRNPRMRVSKKNLTAEGDAEVERQEDNDWTMVTNDKGVTWLHRKQEGEDMPVDSGTKIERPGDNFWVKVTNSEGVTWHQRKQEGGRDMPFGIVRREEGDYCVINTDTEEEMGCHETEDEAEAQLAALRINVEAEEGESAHHTDKPRKRKPKKKEVEDQKESTFFDRLKLAAKNIIDIVTLAETEENEVKLFVNKVGIAQKMVNGELWHFTYSTNAFEDREGEIFSTKSLERYVEGAKEKDDRGFFNLWHIAGTDFARKEWQDVIGRFLVEAGPYLDDERGRAAAEFFKEYGGGHPELAPEGWGCSPEFRYLPEERATGTYENIWITRTSTLPKMAAANIWTETRQLVRDKMAYSEDQIKAAIEVFQDEDFVKTLFNEGETKTAELEAAGVAHKEKDEPKTEDQPAPQEVQLNMEELAAEVGKQFQADLTPIGDAIVTMAAQLKELRDWRAKIEKEQGIKDKTETPRFIFNLQRASESEATIVTDDDGLKNQKPIEAKANNVNDPWAQTFNK